MSDHYKIIEDGYKFNLEAKVDELWKDGWRPRGSPLFIPEQNSMTGGGRWYQAMVKDDVPAEHLSYSVSSSNIPEVNPVTPLFVRTSPPPQKI